jgi:hypothetical protein
MSCLGHIQCQKSVHLDYSVGHLPHQQDSPRPLRVKDKKSLSQSVCTCFTVSARNIKISKYFHEEVAGGPLSPETRRFVFFSSLTKRSLRDFHFFMASSTDVSIEVPGHFLPSVLLNPAVSIRPQRYLPNGGMLPHALNQLFLHSQTGTKSGVFISLS